MRRLAVLVVLFYLSLAVESLSVAQTAAAPSSAAAASQPPATFRTESRMVLVPVVVTDSKGNHVHGVTRDEFAVYQDGVQQKLATFEEIQTSNARTSHPSRPPGVYDNSVLSADSSKRLTIIALDTLNTSFADQAYARSEILKFVAREVDVNEPVALVTIGRHGTRLIHDFTTDPAILIRALKQVSGELPAQGVEADATYSAEFARLSSFVHEDITLAPVQRTDRIVATLEAFEHIAQAFAAIPGRKSLIWATAGFPFYLNPDTATGSGVGLTGGISPFRIDVADQIHLKPLFERAFQMLNDSNVAVYPVDVRGVTGVLGSTSTDTMRAFANMTGGRAFIDNNDLSGLFQKSADDCSSYYMLAYYLPQGIGPGWHVLKVKARGGALHSRSRDGFFVAPPIDKPKDADEQRRNDVAMAIVSPLEYTAVPFAVQWIGAPEGDGAKKSAKFTITVLPQGISIDPNDRNAVRLEFVAAAYDPKGTRADQFSQTLEARLKPEDVQRIGRQGLHYSSTIQVAAGDYTVHFVVRDDLTGRIGSVSAPLTVK